MPYSRTLRFIHPVLKNLHLLTKLVMFVLSHFSDCPALCNPMDHSPPGSSVHGILQARILKCVAVPSSRGDLPDPGIELVSVMSPPLAGRFFTTSATWEAC